jgi:CheY-like chemotaxis protein
MRQKTNDAKRPPEFPAEGNTGIPALRGTAPGARILVVDDIEINLDVAEGILSPYGMTVDRASGGPEALRMVRETQYDLVFMDHLMPGMDGIETAAAIRAWEESQGKKGAPIIALTASDVFGMEEQFLEKGFNGYISKPIEIDKLDGILGRWMPAEKWVKTAVKRETFSGSGGLGIPGVDVNRGINLTGGTETGYRRVLAQFCKDAAERLPLFAAFPAGDGDRDGDRDAGWPRGKPGREDSAGELSGFIIQAHAIKSAAGTIGAAELSKEAAALEAAGQAGDTGAVHRILPGFCEHLARLIGEIGKALEEDRDRELPGTPRDSTAEKDPPSAPPFSSALSALRAALEARNMREVDRLLEELDRRSPDAKIRDAVNDILDRVLMAEYGEARNLIDRLLAIDPLSSK